MHPSKHHMDDDATNDQPPKKTKLDFLVHDMPSAQSASTSSQPQKMKLEFLLQDTPSAQHAAALPQPVPSVHFGQDSTVNQDGQDHTDAALDRMDAALGLIMLSQAQPQHHDASPVGFDDEEATDAARLLQQMASDDGHASPMQLDEDVRVIPEDVPSPQQPTYDRVEGVFALLMLARDFADPHASGFDHFIDEDAYNANASLQQSALDEDQAVISAQSPEPKPVPAFHPKVDSRPRGDQDDAYQAPPGLDHDEVFRHHDQLWLNDLTPGTLAHPEASPHDQANHEDPPDDEPEQHEVQAPARSKRGKKAKAAATPRSSRKSRTTDNADVDDWQPPIPPDDEDDGDFKASAYLKRGSNAKVSGVRWSSRTKKVPANMQNKSPSPSPPPASPSPTPLPSPPPTSRRPKANKPAKPKYNEGLMPSESNNFKFQYDSPSGRTAAHLDALLKVPARPKKFPLDLNKKDQMPVSYNQLHQMPKPGLAAELVAKMEKEHAKEIRGWDDAETDEEV